MNLFKPHYKNVQLTLSLFFLIFTFQQKTFAQNEGPKKIHLISMLDLFSDYSDSNSEGLAIRLASEKLEATLKSKSKKLANDLTNGQVEFYDIFDDPNEQSPERYTNANKNKFSKANVIKLLDSISCTGDIVIVIFNGHGFNAANTPPILDASGQSITYPDLIFHYNQPENEDHFIPYHDILCALQKKNPALIVSLINACQIEIDTNVINDISPNYGKAYTKGFLANFNRAGIAPVFDPNTNVVSVRKTRTKELFDFASNPNYNFLNEDQILSIEMLSCSKGEYTWVDAEGGHFMTSFLDSFNEALKGSETAKWEQIAANVIFKTKHRIDAYNSYAYTKKGINFEKHVQTPQCKVFVKDANCEAPPRSLPIPEIALESESVVVNTPTPNFYEYTAHVEGRRKTPHWLARRFVKLGESYRVAGNPQQAIDVLVVAIPVLAAKKDDYRLATAYERLGLAYKDIGKIDDARDSLVKAKKIFDKLNVDGSKSTIQAMIEQLDE